MLTTYDNIIEQIAQSIFATMLNVDLIRVDEGYAPQECDALLSTIQISGKWTGTLVLTLSSNLARCTAASMLNVVAQDATAEDLNDVAAELVNMLGGNLKSVLPGPSYLSLPTVIAGREFDLQIHNAELIDNLVMMNEHGTLQASLYIQKLVT